MSREERYWVSAYAALLVFLTTVPYLLAAQAGGEEWVFSGHLIAVEDGNSYIAKMLRGSQGDWLFRTPYTVSEQAGVAVFIPYLILGKLLSPGASHDKFILLFHFFRSVGVVISVLGTYRFAAHFIDEVGNRRWVTVLGTIGGGLGWILLTGVAAELWRDMPLVFISPESFGFLAAVSLPHLILARGLLLLGLVAYLEQQNGDRRAASPAVLIILTALVHPLSGAIAVGVIGLHQLAGLGAASVEGTWADWKSSVSSAAAMTAPALLYFAYLAFRAWMDPFLQGWAAQNQIDSPHLGYYFLAWGFLGPLALIGARRALRSGESDRLLLVVWAIALPMLAYAPVGVQRRLVEGGWVVLATLGAMGLGGVRESEWRVRIKLAVLALSLPGSLLILLGAGRHARLPSQPAFVPSEKAGAFQWLDERAQADEIVLAGVRTGNQLPAWTPVRVPIGHGPESVPFETIRDQVESFYAAASEAERSHITGELGVDYVIVGPAERELAGGSFSPSRLLSEVYVSGPYSVYRVDHGTP